MSTDTKSETTQRVSTCTPLVKTEDLLHYERTFWDSEFIEKILIPRAKITNESSILIAGCGVGAIGRFISKYFPMVKITALEISRASIDAGKEINEHLGIENITFIEGNILDLDKLIPEEEFDFVFDDGVLSYFPNKKTEQEALKQLIKATKPGGVIGSFQLDYSAMMFGTSDPKLRNAFYKVHEAFINYGFSNPDESRKRNLIIAPQLFQMFWEHKLENIKVYPYIAPEPLPPYKPEDIGYLDKRIQMYTKGTPEYNAECEKLVIGGLTELEFEKYSKILREYWNERKLIQDAQGVPSFLTQVFLLTFGEKSTELK
ncbi:MAG: class I SAM-dependent methyltransferase [Bacillota bacterium]